MLTLGLKEAKSRSLKVNWTSPVEEMLRETRKVLFQVTWCGFDKRLNEWMPCRVSKSPSLCRTFVDNLWPM